MCSKEGYINPFSQESEIYAKKLNDAIIAEDYVQLEKLLDEIEMTIPDVDAASQARLYYSNWELYTMISQELRG